MKREFKLLSEIKRIFINGDYRYQAIVVPIKYSKKIALQKAKEYYLKEQKINKYHYTELKKYKEFNRFCRHNKIIKYYAENLEFTKSLTKEIYNPTRYKCWLIDLTNEQTGSVWRKRRSKKATQKIRTQEIKTMDKIIDMYIGW